MPRYTWTGTVHFLTGRRWEGPFAVAVDGSTPAAAATRAVAQARQRIRSARPRVRVEALQLRLQRMAPPRSPHPVHPGQPA